MRKLALFSLVLLQTNSLIAQPLDEQIQLDVGGNDIYLEIAGPHREAPLLVFLHGGPGNAAISFLPFRAETGRQLEQEFLIAYMHQRGDGKSSSVPASELTVSAHIDDVAKVVDFLMERYDQEKVHLLGHSWGGQLAVLYADAHREAVDSLILVSSPMSSTYRDSLEFTLEWAQEVGNSEAVAQLIEMDPDVRTLEGIFTLNRWTAEARGGMVDFAKLFETYDINGEYPNWQERRNTILEAMGQEVSNLDLSPVISSLEIPALFVSSARDAVVPEKTMRRDYENYAGPKQFVVLEDSHHIPFIDQPDDLAEAIRSFLLE